MHDVFRCHCSPARSLTCRGAPGAGRVLNVIGGADPSAPGALLASLRSVTLDFVWIAIVALVTGFAEMAFFMMAGAQHAHDMAEMASLIDEAQHVHVIALFMITMPFSLLPCETALELRLAGVGRRARAQARGSPRASALATSPPSCSRRGRPPAPRLPGCGPRAHGRPARMTVTLPCGALRAALSALYGHSDAPFDRAPGGRLL